MSRENKELRELLQLRCDVERLKINQSYQKKQHTKQEHHQISQLLNTAASISAPVWQLSQLPKQRKYRIALLLLAFFAQFWGRQK